MAWSRLDWLAPVLVRLPDRSDPELIFAVDEAIEFMATRWPAEKTDRFWEAATLCSRCVHGQVGPMAARQALVAAAKDAEIHVAI